MLIDANGALEDRFAVIGADDPLPETGPVLVPLARLDEISGQRETGIHVGPDQDPRVLPAVFDRVVLISVGFPSFADGRGFSIGRCLRQLGYEGRLRATGPVIADQFAYLLACGYDEAAIPDSVAERQPVEQWLAQLTRISAGYQRGLATSSAARSILDARTGR